MKILGNQKYTTNNISLKKGLIAPEWTLKSLAKDAFEQKNTEDKL
jgi:hypothetical protein